MSPSPARVSVCFHANKATKILGVSTAEPVTLIGCLGTIASSLTLQRLACHTSTYISDPPFTRSSRSYYVRCVLRSYWLLAHCS